MRLVIALGGNAMTAADGSARPADQERALVSAAEPIADLVALGHQVVVTHGNGPQVGNLLVKNEIAAGVVPPVPLDWCGAQTQATIGTLLLNALDDALGRRGVTNRSAALISRTRVSEHDAGFVHPTKPIGRYLSAAEAHAMIDHGQRWEDCGEPGWRRVVASPEPIECIDLPAAEMLLTSGYVVVCFGGGGIPVTSEDGARLRGVEAVIDKDLTAAQVAITLRADRLVIATDVSHVMLGWGSANPQSLERVSVADLRGYAAAGHFASGSMAPKVEAVCRFCERTEHEAVITSLGLLPAALNGAVGTTIYVPTE